MLDFLKSGAHPDVREDLQDMYFKLTFSLGLLTGKVTKDLACSANTVISPRFSPLGVSRGRDVRGACLSLETAPCGTGRDSCIRRLKRGQLKGKGGKVLNLQCATVTLESLTNVRFSASKVFKDLKLCANTL